MERNHAEEYLNFKKGDMEVFKATKSRFALRFLRFARDNLKLAEKLKPNRGLQIDFTRPGKTLQYGKCCF